MKISNNREAACSLLWTPKIDKLTSIEFRYTHVLVLVLVRIEVESYSCNCNEYIF